MYNWLVLKIVECVPNFSEGKRLSVIKKIANAGKIKGAKILDIEWDKSHNRSLVTIVGSPDAVFKSVFLMIKMATKLIDMEKHIGEHPRIGATDVVPFIPVAGMSMKECIDLAKKLGRRVAKELGIPVYLYESAATRKERTNLADVRIGQYEGLKESINTKERKPDFGKAQMHKSAGAIVIGARKYLIAYNINLDTKDVNIAKQIAGKIREKGGGLPGVKALGFLVNGFAQISMNLVDYEKTNFDKAYFEIEKEAKKLNVKIKNSEIYGMIPLDSLVKSIKDTYKVEKFITGQILEKRLYE
jgi:glutamate formiminotransferase